MAQTRKRLPPRGAAREEVLGRMQAARDRDAGWKEGRTWSLVYHAGDDITRLLQDAYLTFFHENGLSPIAFPSLRRFEAEVVAMAADLLGGDDQVAGNMTAGGSESILMAVKTARDRARAERPDVTAPEMVVPVTAHPAFLKAAHYLGVKAVRIPVTPDYRADVAAAGQAINDRTVLLVGSAPPYPHGVIDPIADLAALAQERGVHFHVDACLGGFLLPFIRRLGYPVPPFDFTLPGVSSISADLHKYGFAAKGASVILYRNRQIRRHQFFAVTDWPGGLFGSPTATGTRPGGAIAAAWAVLNYLGEEGYLRLAGTIMRTTRTLMDGIRAIPGLRILGQPEMSVFAFTVDGVNIFALAEAMAARGWHLDLQQDPACLHLMVTPAHAASAETFLADLRQATAALAAAGGGTPTGMAAMYGALAATAERELVADFILDVVDGWTRVEEP